jgi:hypothetical protein
LLYRAHGLTIASSRPISELVEAGAQDIPDLIIRFEDWPADLGEPSPWFESPYRAAVGKPDLVATRRGAGRWLEFTYADGAAFLIDVAATEIRVSQPSTLTASGLAEYLLGPILGIVLRLRGVVCLHASAVAVGARALAFVGPAGSGKSTMAATFARGGVPVLSDDTITLSAAGPSWCVAPAYPRVRLWPDAVAALGAGGDLRLVAPGAVDSGSRHQLDLASSGLFACESVPLGVIYVMEFDDGLARPRIGAISPAAALPVLSANTFANRVLDRERRAREFATLAEVLARVPVRRLARACNLADLAQVRDTILDDIAASVP